MHCIASSVSNADHFVDCISNIVLFSFQSIEWLSHLFVHSLIMWIDLHYIGGDDDLLENLLQTVASQKRNGVLSVRRDHLYNKIELNILFDSSYGTFPGKYNGTSKIPEWNQIGACVCSLSSCGPTSCLTHT